MNRDRVNHIYDVTFDWQGRQLMSISDLMFFTYNADGQRTSKYMLGEETTEFFYNGSILAGQKCVNDTITFMYDNNGDYFGFNLNGVDYYYLKNAQNDVIAITDANGAILARYNYDAWGRVLSVTDGNGNWVSSDSGNIGHINPIRYRSYYTDSETQFYYLNSRYYVPDMFRFINADAVVAGIGESVQGYNLFAYCMNNPVNMSDESGHWPTWNDVKNAAKNIVNSVKNVVSSVVSTVKTAVNNIVSSISNKLPTKGKPNSKKKSPNGKQEREYGPDGKAKKDTDYGHPEHHPELPSPHAHDWEWNGNKPTRGPAYAPINWGNIVLGVGLTAICAVGIAWVVGNDVTGIGVADDFLIAPLGTGAGKGLILIFGG